MAARRRPAGKKTRRKSRSSSSPGWLWMLFGLGVGLSVAAAIYVADHRPTTPRTAPTRPAPARAARTEEPAPAEEPSLRYRFYEVLPKFEVVIPDDDLDDGKPVQPVDKPGVYMLQTGSFSTHADADRMKAQLGLLGMTSRIQRVSVDDVVYYRVRVGPFEDLDELNAMRARLRKARIEPLVLRVGDR